MPTKKTKPEKPYPEFPLTATGNGQWAKKIKGRRYYFGVWDDPDAALKEYLRVRDYLLNGKTPPPSDDDRITMRDVVNHCLTDKRHRMLSGELTERSFADLYSTGGILVEEFRDQPVEDLTPTDFARFRAKLAKGRAPKTLGNLITRCRIFLNFAFNNCLIDRPVRIGTGFDMPSKLAMRKARQAAGSKLFSAEELRLLINNASQPLRSMILLAANSALGCTDLGGLKLSNIEQSTCWLDYPRVKTAVERRAPLWPETIEAINEWLARRPQAASEEHEELVYLTRFGQPFVRFSFNESTGKPTKRDNVATEFGKLQGKLGISKPRRGFYGIRHTWRTVADRCRDQRAAACIMGHEMGDIASHYVERIDDDRLIAVSDYVREWLFGGER